MVRGLASWASYCSGRRCEGLCLPGGDVVRVTEALPPSEEKVLVTWVGTNDVGRERSELLKEKMRVLLQQLAERGSRSVLVGILPRMHAGMAWNGEAFALNTWLSAECSSRGILFLDLWERFAWSPHLYCSDGVHLNGRGVEIVGDVLGGLLRVDSFFR
jgi:lysophospholipase L1-like esterase